MYAALIFLLASMLAVSATTVTADHPPRGSASVDHRLDVEGAWSPPYGGSITSWKRHADGSRVYHGVQVIVGPQNSLREYAVYNNGALEQRTQFYPNGDTFRYQRREHNGEGYEVVYAPMQRDAAAAPKKPAATQETLCLGRVRADKRWEGTFLVWERTDESLGQSIFCPAALRQSASAPHRCRSRRCN
ncbi:MAG TPA: hypothetical protein VFA18_12830 [Gemmataceae bacterium]|nr:hypothetical protein [Gemmataceae bacterium]